MKRLGFLLPLLLTAICVCAQTTNIHIYDDNGNVTTGTLNNGHLYLQDNSGTIVTGTIRDGHVFLNGSNGDITFGTVRDGNVFLTDKNGLTTGTIRNGVIFLANSDGSITTGSYHGSTANITTSEQTNIAGPISSCDTGCQNQQNYQAGYEIGVAAGTALRVLVKRLTTKQVGLFRMRKSERIVADFENGTAFVCSTKKNGKCRTVEAPLPVRAQLLMEGLRKSLADSENSFPGWSRPDNPFAQAAISSWRDMRAMYCRFARQGLEPSMTYVDLEGKVQTCAQ